MITLYQYLPAWTVPCISPYVTKVAYYMTMSGLKFDTKPQDLTRLDKDTPAGKLDRSIAVPAAKPAMCCFGGARMDQLFITSITPAQPIAGYEPALAGAVFVAHPGVRGIAETPFSQ